MSEPKIVWEEPPPSNSGRGSAIWMQRLAPLMKHPGKWARIHERVSAASAASAARNLRSRAILIPAGRWEFVSRSVDGKGLVYARYLGPEE